MCAGLAILSSKEKGTGEFTGQMTLLWMPKSHGKLRKRSGKTIGIFVETVREIRGISGRKFPSDRDVLKLYLGNFVVTISCKAVVSTPHHLKDRITRSFVGQVP